jgi:hypothetical protein
MAVLSQHLCEIAGRYAASAALLEWYLAREVQTVLGKTIQPWDLLEYTNYTLRRTLAPEYWPRPLAFTVRREGDHSAEGDCMLEVSTAAGEREAAKCLTARSPASGPIWCSLDASTRLALQGDRYVHGWLRNSFGPAAGGADGSGLQLQLRARVRQFGCVILLLGTLTAADAMEIKHAIVLRNQDELCIPLLLEVSMATNVEK